MIYLHCDCCLVCIDSSLLFMHMKPVKLCYTEAQYRFAIEAARKGQLWDLADRLPGLFVKHFDSFVGMTELEVGHSHRYT